MIFLANYAAPTLPAMASAVPADGGTLPTNGAPAITWDKTIQLGDAGDTFLLRNVSASTDIETWDVGTEAGTGAGQVEASGAVSTLHPTALHPPGKNVAVRWSAGAVENVNGLECAANAGDTQLNYVVATPSIVRRSTTWSTTTGSGIDAGDTVTNPNTILVDTQDANLVVVLMSIAERTTGDTLTFTSLQLTNGTDFRNPGATSIQTNDSSSRAAAIAWWKDVPDGTWWPVLVPATNLDWLEEYVVLFKNRGKDPTLAGGVSGAGVSATVSPTTTNDNEYVILLKSVINTTTTGEIMSVTGGGSLALIEASAIAQGGACVAKDQSSLLLGALIAAAGATSTTITWTNSLNHANVQARF